MKIYYYIYYIIVFFSINSHSFSNNNSEKHFFVITLPKGGSALLCKCLELITKKKTFIITPYSTNTKPGNAFHLFLNKSDFVNLPNSLFPWSHLYFTDKIKKLLDKLHYKKIFIYRDPRDWLVSWVHWFSGPSGQIFPNPSWEFSKKINYCINSPNGGVSDYINFGTIDNIPDFINKNAFEGFYEPFIKWIDDPNCYSIKFEDLVGPKGGGSLEAQIKTIKQLAKYIDYDLTKIDIQDDLTSASYDNVATYIANKLFGGTWNFRQGQIGSWKKYFSQENKDLVKKLFGQRLIDLGYEKDLNW